MAGDKKEKKEKKGDKEDRKEKKEKKADKEDKKDKKRDKKDKEVERPASAKPKPAEPPRRRPPPPKAEPKPAGTGYLAGIDLPSSDSEDERDPEEVRGGKQEEGSLQIQVRTAVARLPLLPPPVHTAAGWVAGSTGGGC